MVVPVSDQAAQQIRPSQERTVARRGTAQHHMVAAAGSTVFAVEIEFFRAEAGLPRVLVQADRVVAQLRPG